MPLTASEFVASLSAQVPETAATINEHLADNGELLLHVLVGDLRLLAIDWFRTDQTDALRRLLSDLEQGVGHGDERVENAIAVSFVEDMGWWEPEMQPFMESLPEGLLAEVERQRSNGG